LSRREDIIEFEIKVNQSVVRMKPLGRDRFCNRYWWFDGGLGTVSLDAITKNNNEVPPKDLQIKPDPEILSEYSAGYLFVEEFHNSDSDPKTNPELYNSESNVRQGLADGEWGYYGEPEQVHFI
jgi:hypothetical protein